MPDTSPSYTELAPRPVTEEGTGLSRALLVDLVSKHLAEAGVLDLGALARRIALPGTLIEGLLAFLRSEGRAEVLGARGGSPFLRFGLTERGRVAAAEAFMRDGYVGPAPVPLAAYEGIVRAQSVRHNPLTRVKVHDAFADTVIRTSLLDRLGPAHSSGRPLFLYGPPGTGKSYISRRLTRLLGPPVLVPHAIAVGETAIRCFDPGVHRVVGPPSESASVMMEEGFDARYALCERPAVIAGGELTLDMLDLRFDSAARLYMAPLQLRANNGTLILDDMGRQRVTPVELFNRWITPLEERRDHLSLKAGQHFSVPFDLVLVFATNFNPLDLADEAFLRRIGYKIRFEEASKEEYSQIWRQECKQNAIEYDPALVAFVIEELHAKRRVPLLACHPRDLIGLAMDHSRYIGADAMDQEALLWAWRNYFVEVSDGGSSDNES
ncbi:MAG: AAA family ATPase [Pseudomonadota bacterium]|nr:AAA family ATPase [Pseudomonadota bacterium]